MPKQITSPISWQKYKPKYAKWLTIYPPMPGRNRWMNLRFNQWAGSTYDIKSVSCIYREELLKLSRTEKASMEANDRLKQNCRHEVSLNKHRARAFELQMGTQIQLLPLHYLKEDIMVLYRLVLSMPDKLLSRFATISMAMSMVAAEFPNLIGDLKQLYEHKSEVMIGSASVRTRVLRREAFSKRRLGIATMYQDGRMLRMQVKGLHFDKDKISNVTSAKGFDSKSKKIRAWGTNSSPYLASISVRDKDHLQWVIAGITIRIMTIEARARDVRKQLYFVTKFRVPWSETGTPSGDFRDTWFRIFRKALDDWCYETPLERQNSNSLFCLWYDLRAIQDFKILHRPELITPREVQLGRDFYIRSAYALRRETIPPLYLARSKETGIVEVVSEDQHHVFEDEDSESGNVRSYIAENEVHKPTIIRKVQYETALKHNALQSHLSKSKYYMGGKIRPAKHSYIRRENATCVDIIAS